MTRLFAVLITMGFCFSLNAQNPYEKLLGKKKKSNITFYKDEAGTQSITKISSGDNVFYAKVPLNKKDFKMPFGKLFGYANFNFIERSAEVQDIKNGHSVSDEKIYYELEEISSTLAELAGSQSEIMVKFKLDNDINFESNVEDVVENGSKVYPLTVWIGKEDEPLGYGVIDWDLSDGGEAYAAAGLASRADYTFKGGDGVVDPEFKALVKADIERRMNIKIYQIAHGERVPYTRNLTFYRRNQFGMTYKDLEDGKCYTGGLSAFEVGDQRTGPYIYENDGTISQGDQIPCDRVDK